MTHLTISTLDIDNPEDYGEASRLLQHELGCWNYHEFSSGPRELELSGKMTLYVLKGRARLDSVHRVEAGQVVVTEGDGVLVFDTEECLKLRSCSLDSLETSSDYLYLSFAAGPIWNSLFQCPDFGRTLEEIRLDELLCYTFAGIDQNSEIYRRSRLGVCLAERVPTLAAEELFRREGEGWYRWMPSRHGKEVTEAFGPIARFPQVDETLELLLQKVWESRPHVLSWMCSAPPHTSPYPVPYLRLIDGTVSESFCEKWEVRAVSSYERGLVSPREVLVTVTKEEVLWECREVWEFVRWGYRRHPDGSVDVTVLEAYD